jgi:hypothetical protein
VRQAGRERFRLEEAVILMRSHMMIFEKDPFRTELPG